MFTLLFSSCFYGSSLLFKESQSKNIPNLVSNPGFEKSDPQNRNMPSDWFVISSSVTGKEPVVSDSIHVREQNKSLKIVKSPSNLYILSDAFKINYTGGYYIKCWVRSQKPMRKSVKVHFWTYDSAGNKRNSFSKTIKAGKDWNQATISAGFLRNSVNFARIAIFVPKEPDNTIWIDDIGCFMVHRFRNE